MLLCVLTIRQQFFFVLRKPLEKSTAYIFFQEPFIHRKFIAWFYGVRIQENSILSKYFLKMQLQQLGYIHSIIPPITYEDRVNRIFRLKK